ncbi:MAG: O-antigen ligase family protein [Clostridia bacterium]|nr:O-antigen ligase family protein [Clostridia bacterium]
MKKLKLVFLDTSLFRISYMLCLFFCTIMYVEKAAYIMIYGLFVWGLALTVYKLVVQKVYKKMYLGIWLIAFLVSFLITTLININLEFNTLAFNLFMLMHCAICFFMFYGINTEQGVPFRWELYLVARLFVYLSTVFTVVGLVFMLFTAGIFDDYMYFNGEVFKGFYTNPNYQGYVSALSVIFCHMLTKPNFIVNSGQKRVSRIWLVSCILFNCVALLLCDSNGSLLLLVVYTALIVLMKFFSMIEDLTPRKIISRFAMLVIIGIVVLALMMFVRVFCRIGVAAFFSDSGLSQSQIEDLSSDALFIPSQDSGFTSRWFLWDAGVKIFRHNPIFGIGKGNLYNAIVEVTGKTNLYSHFEGLHLIAYTDLHNGFLTILVTAGIVGAALFAVFIVRYLMMILPVWYVQRRIMVYSVYPCLLAFIGAYFCYALIEKTVLFDLTYLVISFWLILGYTSCYALDFGYMRRGNFYVFGKEIHRKLI